MHFASDGATWACPEVLDRLAAERVRTTSIFDADEITAALKSRVERLFETEVDIFPVISGSAANGLALGAITPSYGAVLCHCEAHIQTDECGAPSMFSGGAKLVGLPGEHGKIDPSALEQTLSHWRHGVAHNEQLKALSITQVTEAGTVYSIDAVQRLAKLAKSRGLRVHMDGARLANAVAALGCRPADLTWRAGIDILCLGGTKNGAIAAELIVVFDRSVSETLRYLRKRSGHFVAKTRFLSLQLDTYLTDDLWLRNARHANRMAARLSKALASRRHVSLVHPTEANEIFVRMPDALLAHLRKNGAVLFEEWRTRPERHHRLVASFATTEAEVDRLVALVDDWLDENAADTVSRTRP